MIWSSRSTTQQASKLVLTMLEEDYMSNMRIRFDVEDQEHKCICRICMAIFLLHLLREPVARLCSCHY